MRIPLAQVWFSAVLFVCLNCGNLYLPAQSLFPKWTLPVSDSCHSIVITDNEILICRESKIIRYDRFTGIAKGVLPQTAGYSLYRRGRWLFLNQKEVKGKRIHYSFSCYSGSLDSLTWKIHSGHHEIWPRLCSSEFLFAKISRKGWRRDPVSGQEYTTLGSGTLVLRLSDGQFVWKKMNGSSSQWSNIDSGRIATVEHDRNGSGEKITATILDVKTLKTFSSFPVHYCRPSNIFLSGSVFAGYDRYIAAGFDVNTGDSLWIRNMRESRFPHREDSDPNLLLRIITKQNDWIVTDNLTTQTCEFDEKTGSLTPIPVFTNYTHQIVERDHDWLVLSCPMDSSLHLNFRHKYQLHSYEPVSGHLTPLWESSLYEYPMNLKIRDVTNENMILCEYSYNAWGRYKDKNLICIPLIPTGTGK